MIVNPGDMSFIDAVLCVIISNEKEPDEKYFVLSTSSVCKLTLKYYVVKRVHKS